MSMTCEAVILAAHFLVINIWIIKWLVCTCVCGYILDRWNRFVMKYYWFLNRFINFFNEHEMFIVIHRLVCSRKWNRKKNQSTAKKMLAKTIIKINNNNNNKKYSKVINLPDYSQHSLVVGPRNYSKVYYSFQAFSPHHILNCLQSPLAHFYPDIYEMERNHTKKRWMSIKEEAKFNCCTVFGPQICRIVEKNWMFVKTNIKNRKPSKTWLNVTSLKLPTNQMSYALRTHFEMKWFYDIKSNVLCLE